MTCVTSAATAGLCVTGTVLPVARETVMIHRLGMLSLNLIDRGS